MAYQQLPHHVCMKTASPRPPCAVPTLSTVTIVLSVHSKLWAATHDQASLAHLCGHRGNSATYHSHILTLQSRCELRCNSVVPIRDEHCMLTIPGWLGVFNYQGSCRNVRQRAWRAMVVGQAAWKKGAAAGRAPC